MNPDPHKPGPAALTRDERLRIARGISDSLREHYKARIKAIGLFGSVARKTDGPFSDVELYCVLDGRGTEQSVEWARGPWKALVNIYSEDIILRDAAVVDGTWPLVQSGYVHTEPLYDPDELFTRVRDIALASADEDFRPSMRELVVGEIYEIVGKARNARERGEKSLPVLSVEMTKACACLIGLDHRHMYVSSSNFLVESMKLPNRPSGYDELCLKVTVGDLVDSEQLSEDIGQLWSGIEKWMKDREIQIYEGLESLLSDP